MSKRRWVYRVLWSDRACAWIVRPDGGTIYSRQPMKHDAVADGRRLAREVHQADGRPTQLVVHLKNGRIEYEATHGRDPGRYKS